MSRTVYGGVTLTVGGVSSHWESVEFHDETGVPYYQETSSLRREEWEAMRRTLQLHAQGYHVIRSFHVFGWRRPKERRRWSKREVRRTRRTRWRK